MRNVALVILVAGCNGCKGGDELSPDLVFEDENNFSYTAELDFGAVEVQAGQDFCVDWSALTTDIRGRPLDPSTVQQILLVDFYLTQQEVLDLILSNSIDQGDSNTAWTWDNSAGATSMCADGNFNAVGNLFSSATNLPEDPTKTWLVTLVNLPNGAYDVLSTQFLVPTGTSTDHDLAFASDSSSITVDADLHSAPALKTQEGIGPYTLDWDGLTKDVNGADWDPLVGDNLIIAHYDGDLASVEADFVRLDTAATEFYTLDVFGTTAADLDDAEDADGNAFGGFTADGTWLVGITCKTCISPLPLAVSVVEVSAAK